MPDETGYSFVVLPWLKVPTAQSFGSVTIAPVSTAVAQDDPRLETVERILTIYRGQGGTPLRPALMWPTGADPLDLSDDDATTVFAHRDWLSAAALMGNEYFSPLDPPFSDANADAYGHRFTIGTEHIGLVKRRRDGQSNDALPIAKMATQMPLSASPSHQFNVDQSLLDAFAGLSSRADDLAECVRTAIPLFTAANQLSERSTSGFDLILLAAALEQLFDIHTPVAQNLADAVADTFSSFTQGATGWDNRAVSSGNLTPDHGPWVKRWAREFYAHRSSIHGGPAPHSSDWADLIHALIATVVFGLAVKIRLSADGTRAMVSDDELAADALDDRIERLASPGIDAAVEWREARLAAQRRAMVAAAAQALSQAAGGSTSGGTS